MFQTYSYLFDIQYFALIGNLYFEIKVIIQVHMIQSVANPSVV